MRSLALLHDEVAVVDGEDPDAQHEDEGQVEEDPAELPAEHGEDLAADADAEGGPVHAPLSLVRVDGDGAAGAEPVEHGEEDDNPTGFGRGVNELVHLCVLILLITVTENRRI